MNINWPVVRLGTLLKRADRFERKQLLTEYQFAGTYSFARGIFVGERKLGNTFRLDKIQRIRTGDFIYCKIMAWEGAFGVAPRETENCVMSGAFVVYEANRQLADPRFLDWYFKLPSVWHSMGSQSTGTNVRRRSLDPLDFESGTIPLPPLDEQRRIVSRLEELFAKVEEAKNLREDASNQAENLLSSKRAEIFKETVAKGVTRLDIAATLERGKFSHRPRNDQRFFGGDHPWIQIGEIESAKKFIRAWTETLNDDGLAISRKFPRGTVLVSIAATIGAVGILDFDCCIPDSIVAVTPKPDIESEFIFHYFGYVRSHLEDVAPQSAQKNINLRILSGLAFPAMPLSEQRRIVVYLDSLQAKVDSLNKLQSETAAELDALMPSILSRAFRGEL